MRRAVMLTAVVLAFLATGAAAQAQARVGVAVVGSFTDTQSTATGPVSGALSIDSFRVEDRTLIATGTLGISLCFPGVPPKNCVASYSEPASVAVIGVLGSCDAITLDFGTFHAVVGDRFVLDLQAWGMLASIDDDEPLDRQLLCSIARRADSNAPLFTLARSLNRL